MKCELLQQNAPICLGYSVIYQFVARFGTHPAAMPLPPRKGERNDFKSNRRIGVRRRAIDYHTRPPYMDCAMSNPVKIEPNRPAVTAPRPRDMKVLGK